MLALASKRVGLPTGAISRKRGRPKKFQLSGKYKIALGAGIFLVFVFSYTVFLLTAAYQLPSPTRLISPNQPVTTEFYDRNGELLYRLYAGNNRSLVKLSEVPKSLIEATIATEDQNFYRHIGIDPVAIARALEHNFRNNTQEGASTITQQLIKNSLLTPEKSYIRKFKEIILALWAERIYSKEEILQMYFNEAPYGGSNMGIAAASQTYFGKSPPELNLAESAYLAGLPASPTQFSPYGSRPDLAKLRQREVLDRMVKDKYVTKQQAEEAFAQNLDIKPPVNNIFAPHFVMYARDLLTEKYGPRVVFQGGLKVYTTLDLKLQETVEKIVKEEVDKLAPLNVQNGAALVADTNGQILAMVGSKDYHELRFGNFNVTTSLRQPGSSIKVITYAAAFKAGFSPGNTILDIPVTFKDGVRSYSPVNYDGTFHGPVSIRTALGSSYNVPAVKMLATIGLDEMLKAAKDLGITTFNEPERFGLSLTLGGGEIKMIDMISVYGSLANLGIKKYPTPFLKVTDSSGNVLEEYQDSGQQILEAGIAYLITDILKDNKARIPAFGPNSLLNIPGYEVAVKTGTSDSKRDNWTFGYTPKFVVGVWVGNPDSSPMNPAMTSGVTGAAPIWNKIMHTLLDGKGSVAFERPPGIIETRVDGKKDLMIAGVIPKSMVRIQKTKDRFIFSDPFSNYATPAAQPASPQGEQANQVIPAPPNL
ncbi:transglycosylase domain-containing protein [Candidatus Daviesbacteria bacterium]|nr:transglycosylase domain-containing protein [Candidatus Daviesbacteria bacterium]MBI4038053.1 transglycosylase domain-containing protein [Candidatus Daviesbacteria bacterium]